MIRTIAIALAATLLVGAAEAKDNHGRSDGRDGGGATGWCPPGLAKKHNGCMPPGLAKKGDFYYDYDYERVDWRDRDREDRYDFYRIGDVVVSADRKTGKILHLFDALGNLID